MDAPRRTVIFAPAEPVDRETLARGKGLQHRPAVDDLIEELRDRPCELVSVAGGWQHRTRIRFAERSAPRRRLGGGAAALSEFEAMVFDGGVIFPARHTAQTCCAERDRHLTNRRRRGGRGSVLNRVNCALVAWRLVAL